MEMVELKTADLIGPTLDWAVANAEGYEVRRLSGKWQLYKSGLKTGHFYTGKPAGFSVGGAGYWQPSESWSQGGPLIDKYGILFGPLPSGDLFASVNGAWESGETHLIASCRAIVAAKLGDTVSVPAELVGGDV